MSGFDEDVIKARADLEDKVSGQIGVIRQTLDNQEKILSNLNSLVARLESVGSILDSFRTKDYTARTKKQNGPSYGPEALTFTTLLKEFKNNPNMRQNMMRSSRVMESIVVEDRRTVDVEKISEGEQEEETSEQDLTVNAARNDEVYDQIEAYLVEQRLGEAIRDFNRQNTREEKQKLDLLTFARHEQLKNMIFEESESATRLMQADASQPKFQQLDPLVDRLIELNETSKATGIILEFAARCLRLVPPDLPPKTRVPMFLGLLMSTHAYLGSKLKGVGDQPEVYALQFSEWMIREFRGLIAQVVQEILAKKEDLEVKLEDLKADSLAAFTQKGFSLDFIIDQFMLQHRAIHPNTTPDS